MVAEGRPSDRAKKKPEPTVAELMKVRHLRVRLVFSDLEGFSYVAVDNGKGIGKKGAGEVLFRPTGVEGEAKRKCFDWIVDRIFTVVGVVDADRKKELEAQKKREVALKRAAKRRNIEEQREA